MLQLDLNSPMASHLMQSKSQSLPTVHKSPQGTALFISLYSYPASSLPSARATDLITIPLQTQGWYQYLEASTSPKPFILVYLSPQFICTVFFSVFFLLRVSPPII